MDPIIARLERLERDYRRSRLWNRVALLALLVVVCAGFAQQQDPKLPDVIKCKRVEAEEIGSRTLYAAEITFFKHLIGRQLDADAPVQPGGLPNGGGFSVQVTNSGALLALGFPRGGAYCQLLAQDKLAALDVYCLDPVPVPSGVGEGRAGPPLPVSLETFSSSLSRQARLAAGPTFAQVAVHRDGRQRAVLGSMLSSDALERQTFYPESTLTLLDKDGKFLEQLPR